MFKFVILLLGAWVLMYTVSYGVWEYKNKNILAAAGVGFLVLSAAVLLLAIF